MEKYAGIILKTHFPKKRKITILEAQGGTLHCVPNGEDLCPGTMILYHKLAQPSVTFINNIEKIGLPLLLARNDLLFFHHILELCYHFVPVESHMPEVFALLERLYSKESSHFQPFNKKIFLIKLFILFGIVPEEELYRHFKVPEMLSGAVDTYIDEAIILKREHEVDVWLDRCLKNHPYYAYFKTAHFLAMNRET